MEVQGLISAIASPASPSALENVLGPLGVNLSLVSSAIQMAGMVAMAFLFSILGGAVKRVYFRIWTRAFLAMAVALVALEGAFHFPPGRWGLECIYYLGEYGFAYWLFLGFTAYSKREENIPPISRLGMAGAVLLACTLASLPGDFTVRYPIHALLLATGLAVSLPQAWRLRLHQEAAQVRFLATLAVGLLALNYFAHGAFMLWLQKTGATAGTGYSAYQSIGDLFFEVLVAFSLVILATVDVRRSLEAANQIMQGERDRLAMEAQTDPLTGCFNRRALDELQGRIGQRSGLVVVLDLDKLKPINDTLGHEAGDAAIQFAAQCFKALLRTHDHLFRTGGDEFVVVAFNLPLQLAERRFERLRETLRSYRLEGGEPCPLSASYGFAEFNEAQPLELALTLGDYAMYARKRARGAARE